MNQDRADSSSNRRPPADLQRRLIEMLLKKEAEERQRIERFGQIRPMMTAEAWGIRLVGTQDGIYLARNKSFYLFLDDFLQSRFGPDWTEAQNRLDLAKSHPITRWHRRGFLRHAKSLEGKAAGQLVPPSGFLAAYLGFAYDLYVVHDNNDLDELLLKRLKHREQFQGARHELFAEATCLRAGFDIEHEDTTAPGRHVEFTAIHKKSGLRFAVEAKSRHRPGVIAHRGASKPVEQPDRGLIELLLDAISKRPSLPFAIFIDVNLDPSHAATFFGPSAPEPQPSAEVISIIETVRRRNGGRDPYNLLIFTNDPRHYTGDDDDTDPPLNWIAYIAQAPEMAITDESPLRDLALALDLYGNIPNFPTQP